MPKIKILPEFVSNQIAAGEVVERPATVIKELVENSLDACATKIIVRFSAGGKNLISVEDNGVGMARADAELAIVRHATSKIASVEDIQSVNTFGFRGEAIPSIASVSRFLLRTNEIGQDIGTEILIHCGKVQHIRDCGLAQGTYIEVSGLLHNLPARRQFLKSDETESIHIVRVMRAFALAERAVKFELYKDGKLLFCSPEMDSWSGRISKLYGDFYSDCLFDFRDNRDGMTIEGALLIPSCTNVNRNEIVCFVNKRQVLSSIINRAIRDAYMGFLPNWQGLVAFIWLDFPKNTLDVNVHPQKREVRFKNEYMIKTFVEKTIYGAIDSFLSSKSVVNEAKFYGNNFTNYTPGEIKETSIKFNWNRDRNGLQLPFRQPNIKGIIESNEEQKISNIDSELSFVGTVFGQFAIFESINGLWAMNIKAASRRVFFEQFLHEQINNEPQCLLLPRVIQIPTIECEILDKAMDLFLQYGIGIERFGKDLCRIDAVPQWLDETLVEKLLLDVISGVVSEKSLPLSLNSKWFAKLACPCINIKIYDGVEKLMELAKLLLSSDNYIIDPDGNITLIEISLNELRNKFGLHDPIISL
ncbi:MAG: DNA mismatch repair endonuclease MutL [Puniceicoccales bacterium]|nr:DNA mismatch repair endonuclease MutL [Puniceicoccales bacterium]